MDKNAKPVEAQGSILKIQEQKGDYYSFLFRTGKTITRMSAKCLFPLTKGIRVHFFYVPAGDNKGKVVEWVPDMADEPTKTQVYRYLLSGRIPWMTKDIADAMLEDFQDGLYLILTSCRSVLEDVDYMTGEEADGLLAFFSTHRNADAQYLKFKRIYPLLTWDMYYAMFQESGCSAAEMDRQLKRQPYILATKAGLKFHDVDPFLISTGALRAGIDRTEGAMVHLFHEACIGNLGENSPFLNALCAPKKDLIREIAKVSGMSEGTAEANVDSMALSSLAKEEVLDHVPCIYYPYAAYNIEKSIHKSLERISAKNVKDKGTAGFLRSIFGKTVKEPGTTPEEILKTASQCTVTLVDADVPGEATAFLSMLRYFQLRGNGYFIMPGNPERGWPGHAGEAYLGELMQSWIKGKKPEYADLEETLDKIEKGLQGSDPPGSNGLSPPCIEESRRGLLENGTEYPGMYAVFFAHLIGAADWARILEGIPAGSKLVLSGEYSQQPPADVYGRVFSDIADSQVFPVIHTNNASAAIRKDTGKNTAVSGLACRLRGEAEEEYTED